MFYIGKSGCKIACHNIPHREKRSPVDWGTPLYSRTPENPTLCILPICPCHANYPGCDNIVNSETSCYSTSRGTQTKSVLVADVLSSLNVSFWGFPGKKRHNAQEAFLDFPSTVQTDLLFLWEGASEYYPQFAQVEVNMELCWGSCLRLQWRPRSCVVVLLFSHLVPSPGPPTYSFCQLPLRRWRMQELKHTQRTLMGHKNHFMLANIYWVPATQTEEKTWSQHHNIYMVYSEGCHPAISSQAGELCPWLPMRELNLPVQGGLAVAPHQQQWWWL